MGETHGCYIFDWEVPLDAFQGDPDCRLTVSIEGFDKKNEPVDELKILWVIVDRRLQWTAHIAEIS